MKYTIEHAIMIPATATQIWHQISELSNIPKWQDNSKDVSLLTTMKAGVGTRARITHQQGRDTVIEITAWYNNLGYQYKTVDGVNFDDNLGRIRLQEVADGTVVQWTFEYDLSGVLSGVRNSLNVKKQIDKHITQSLRNLYTYIKDIIADEAPESLPAAIRPAPTVEERQQYQPKHPSIYMDSKDDTSEHPVVDFSPPPMVDFEPPLKDDDTKPNPALAEDKTISDEVRKETIDSPPHFAVMHNDTPYPDVDPVDTEIKDAHNEQFVTKTEEPEQATSATDTLPAPSVLSRPSIDPKLDTAQVSVFDVFGVQKPSQTQEMLALTPDKEIQEPILVNTKPPVINNEDPSQLTDVELQGRIGFRLKLRQSLIKLRRMS